MEFAVNYSPTLAGLVQEKNLGVDRFKCPAWPDLIAEAESVLPVYIHLPITVGSGAGCPLNDEKRSQLDFTWLAGMLKGSTSPYVNTHLIAHSANFPAINPLDHSKKAVRSVVDAAMRDLEPLINLYGAEKVLVENVVNEYGWLDACALPETLALLIEKTGCGFLFDLSHARLTAELLGMEERSYISAMPLHHLQELHVTGLAVLEGELLELVRSAGDPYGLAAHMAGKKIDHLPMREEDWPVLEWAVNQIFSNKWAEPWIVSFEYGGVGPFWGQITSEKVYIQQIPRMAALIHKQAFDQFANHVENL
jgi:uncharacterized protein